MLLSNLYIHLKELLLEKFSMQESKILVDRVFLLKKNYSKTDLVLKSNENITQIEFIEFEKIVARLKTDEPIEYIFNNSQFLDLQLFVDNSTLIPRPETEELVLKISDYLNSTISQKIKIIDIGTGSGCIPVYLASKFKDAQVFACDISVNALNVAKKNAEHYNLDINFFLLDVLEYEKFTIPEYCFDIIVSNPPYVMNSEKKMMKNNVLDYEPYSALFVDDNNPLIFYKKICDFSKKYLVCGGKIFFEINEKFGHQIELLMKELGFNCIKIYKDYFQKDRIVEAVKI